MAVEYTNTFFPTASNCAIFINGHHIDLAYKFDYRESNQRLPIFGYNDYHFGRMAKGRNMVQLSLIINFVHPNYLSYVFDPAFKSLDSSEDPDDEFFRRQFDQQTNADEGRKAKADSIAKLLDDKVNKRKFKEDIYKITELDTLEKNQRSYNSPATHSASEGAKPNLNLIGPFQGNSATIDVYYTDPTLSLFRVSFLDVNIFDVSQEISQMGMDGSSSPLYEIYQMYASKREIRTIRS